MRPKFLAILSAFVLVVVGALLMFKYAQGTTPPLSPKETGAVSSSPIITSRAEIDINEPAPTRDHVSTPPSKSEQTSVAAQVERLTQLSLQNDPASLPEVLVALTSPEPEVRAAALDAAIQLGDSNTIPDLKVAADRATDVSEKIALLEAIDFLSVPPLTFESAPAAKTPAQVATAERMKALRRQEALQDR